MVKFWKTLLIDFVYLEREPSFRNLSELYQQVVTAHSYISYLGIDSRFSDACDIYFDMEEDDDLVIGGFVTKSISGTKRFRTSIDEVRSQENLLGLVTKDKNGKPQFINAAENYENVTKRKRKRQ